jgi:hypothetical protein
LCVALAFAAGCAEKKKTVAQLLPPRYEDRGLREGLPEFMRGSLYERVDLGNTEPYAVSNYGLVGRLRGTGDTFAPNAVRLAMYKEIVRRGFGNPMLGGFRNIAPDDVLRDPNYAIVQVDGYIPAGARKGDWVDLYVRALPKNKTTSLAHGMLFETDLKLQGTERVPTFGSSGSIEVFAQGKGPIMVNPQYALDTRAVPDTAVLRSLRTGVVLGNSSAGGGRVKHDRPILLQLRQPQLSTARAIEHRIDERFQDQNVAAAFDEGIVQVYVPTTAPYKGDWQHFMAVVTHLFLNGSPQYSALKAGELANEAQRPDAALDDISHCWEALGTPAVSQIMPLLAHPRADVAFAAARAVAFIGDASGAAHATLINMAATKDHPFQIAALRVLAKLPPSGSLNLMLRRLLDSDERLVRVEAYQILAENKDPSVYTQVVRRDEGDERFVLDVVASRGNPLVYATVRGTPRIAIIGKMPALRSPVVVRALDDRLTISSAARGRAMTIFYRDDRLAKPIKMMSNPDLAEVLARLGGEGAPTEDRLDFTYGEVVALVKQMIDENRLWAVRDDGKVAPATFMLQESGLVENEVFTAPPLDIRPQDEPDGLDLPAEQNDGRDGTDDNGERDDFRQDVATPLGLPTDEAGRAVR